MISKAKTFIILFFLLNTKDVFAQISLAPNLKIQDVFDIITGLACWLTRVAGLLIIIFIVIAGIQFMAAGGDPTKWENAKKNFKMVLWGTLVILGVYVIIATVANAVGATNFSLVPLVC